MQHEAHGPPKEAPPGANLGGDFDLREPGQLTSTKHTHSRRRRDAHASARSPKPRFKCLREAVEWADRQPERVVYVCVCPCGLEIILPDRPIPLALPTEEEAA